MERKERDIQQRIITLPYFDYDISVLYVQDGTAYIPVIALCRMLGLCAETYIPRWRKLVLWSQARKLPWQTPTGKTRLVWCLQLGALPLWCGCFDWSLVSAERQKQLSKAFDAWDNLFDQVQQKMLDQYKQMRRLLFRFLSACADVDTILSNCSPWMHVLLDRFDVCIQFEDLLAQGRNLIHEATTHARVILREQGEIPIVDAMHIDLEGQVLEESSLPLFPVVFPQQCIQFFDDVVRLTQWHRMFALFLQEHICL